jgi:hypothetical protein
MKTFKTILAWGIIGVYALIIVGIALIIFSHMPWSAIISALGVGLFGGGFLWAIQYLFIDKKGNQCPLCKGSGKKK